MLMQDANQLQPRATLALLQERHNATFPFETLTTLLRDAVAIDLPSVAHKLLRTLALTASSASTSRPKRTMRSVPRFARRGSI